MLRSRHEQVVIGLAVAHMDGLATVELFVDGFKEPPPARTLFAASAAARCGATACACGQGGNSMTTTKLPPRRAANRNGALRGSRDHRIRLADPSAIREAVL